MTQDFVIGIAREALETMIMVSLPILLTSMTVGLCISIFQSVTQIQEMTLTFVPKILITFVAIIFFGPWIVNRMADFMREIITNIPLWIK